MKDKALFLIIGILLGAIITAGVFMLTSKNNTSDDRFQRGDRGDFDMNNLPEGFDFNNMPGGMSGNQIAPPEQTTNSI